MLRAPDATNGPERSGKAARNPLEGRPGPPAAWNGARRLDLYETPAPMTVATSLTEWRGMVAEALVPVEFRAAEHDFHAALRDIQIAGSHLVDLMAQSGHHALRTRSLASRASTRFLKAGILLEGEGVMNQDGREASILPGDLILYVTDRPYEFRFGGAFRLGVVLMPNAATGRLPGFDSVTARVIRRGSGPATVTGAMLRALLIAGDQINSTTAVRTSDALLDLLDSCVAYLTEADGVIDKARLSLYRRACHLIDTDLADSNLSPGWLAAEIGISVSYLHRIFAAFGHTVYTTIRDHRLAAAREALQDPRQQRRTIAAIACDFGFQDQANFSRAFHVRYGFPPREARAIGTSREAQSMARLSLTEQLNSFGLFNETVQLTPPEHS